MCISGHILPRGRQAGFDGCAGYTQFFGQGPTSKPARTTTKWFCPMVPGGLDRTRPHRSAPSSSAIAPVEKHLQAGGRHAQGLEKAPALTWGRQSGLRRPGSQPHLFFAYPTYSPRFPPLKPPALPPLYIFLSPESLPRFTLLRFHTFTRCLLTPTFFFRRRDVKTETEGGQSRAGSDLSA